SAIDTRFFDHAKSEMGGIGKAPGPQYAPEVVADAILYAAAHPKRDFPVGASAVIGPIAEQLAPGAVDRTATALRLEDLVDFGHQPTAHSVSEVPDEGEERSRFGHGRRYSLSTSAQIHPGIATVVTAAGLAVASGLVMTALLAAGVLDRRGRDAGSR
nr:hypothetical protein [Paracoccaceae bacterium]